MSHYDVAKDVLNVLIVPLTLGLLTFLWPISQRRRRKKAFERLIVRELSEAGPLPHNIVDKDGQIKQANNQWKHYVPTGFIHKRVLYDPSSSLEFILSIDANLVYTLGQLWASVDTGSDREWIFHLGKIANTYKDRKDLPKKHREDLVKVFKDWDTRIKSL